MTKPPNGTVPFDSSDNPSKTTTEEKNISLRNTSYYSSCRPPPPFERKNRVGGAAEKNAQLPGLNRQTSDYLTSARARHRTSCLLVPGVGMLTYARCLACKDCVRGLCSKPNLFYPSSRYRHAIFSLPMNPVLSVTSFAEAVTLSTDNRYFVYGQNYPNLRSHQDLYVAFFWCYQSPHLFCTKPGSIRRQYTGNRVHVQPYRQCVDAHARSCLPTTRCIFLQVRSYDESIGMYVHRKHSH